MITTKQRAFLRSLANEIVPITQIGKQGVGENLITTVIAALEKHELVKLAVLEASPVSAKEAMILICEAVGCEAVQVIGRKIVVYKQSAKEENRKIVLPR